MSPLLFILFGLVAAGVIIVLARDRASQRERTVAIARNVALGSAGALLLVLVLIFTGVFSGPQAQAIVTTGFLVLVALMLGALWMAYRPKRTGSS